MPRAVRIYLLLVFVSVCGLAAAAPQPSASATPAAPQFSASPTASNPGPTPIPVAKIPLEADSAVSALQEINARLSRDQSTANLVAASLVNLASEIDARISDDTRLLEATSSLETLHWLAVTWEKLRDSLSACSRELTQCAASLGQEIALVVLYFVGQIRALAAAVPEFARLIIVGQMLGAFIFLWWLTRRSRFRNADAQADRRTLRAIRIIARIGLILFPAVLFCNISGFVNLGNFFGIVFLRSMYVAATFYTATRIIEGFIIVGLQVRPIGSLRSVKVHRLMLQQRACRLLEGLVFLFWLSQTLNF